MLLTMPIDYKNSWKCLVMYYFDHVLNSALDAARVVLFFNFDHVLKPQANLIPRQQQPCSVSCCTKLHHILSFWLNKSLPLKWFQMEGCR